MTELNRRDALKTFGAATSALTVGSAFASQEAAASWTSVSINNECDAQPVLGDTDADGGGQVDPAGGGSKEHEVYVWANADVYADNACADGERITTTLEQQRFDCSDGSTYWQAVASTTAQCKNLSGSCDDNTSSGLKVVPTEGSGWGTTGYYRVTLIPCFYWSSGCHTYDASAWNCTETDACSTKSKQFTVSNDLGNC